MPHDKKTLMKGAFILTVAAFITKILSAVYRIPFQNIVGDVGFYIYQQVYPFYGISVVLAMYGFPVMISKLIVESTDEKEVQKILQISFQILMIVGLLLFSLIFFGSPFIASKMGDPQLKPLIQVISFTYLFLPFLSVWRGYFQGQGNMVPTAVSQIVDQTIRVVTIIGLSYLLVARGYSAYTASGGALFGSITGAFAGLLVLFYFIWLNKGAKCTLIVNDFEKIKKIGKLLLLQGTAICISNMLFILFQFVDSFNLYSSLVEGNVSDIIAKEWKGVYDRGQPLAQLGIVVSSSLSLTLVPVVTAASKRGDLQLLHNKVKLALKVSIIIGAGATIGLINIIEPVNTMLFANNNGSAVLAVFSISILFSSIILTISGILHGLGHLYAPVKYIGIGLILKLLGNKLLVPIFFTMGASLATVISLIITAILFIRKLQQYVQYRLFPMSFYKNLLLALIAMTVVLQMWLWAFEPVGRGGNTVVALSAVLVGGVTYLVIILSKKLLLEDELEQLPLGSTFARLIRKRINH